MLLGYLISHWLLGLFIIDPTALVQAEHLLLDMATSMAISAQTRDGEWARALAAIENELRRAREDGRAEDERSYLIEPMFEALAELRGGRLVEHRLRRGGHADETDRRPE